MVNVGWRGIFFVSLRLILFQVKAVTWDGQRGDMTSSSIAFCPSTINMYRPNIQTSTLLIRSWIRVAKLQQRVSNSTTFTIDFVMLTKVATQIRYKLSQRLEANIFTLRCNVVRLSACVARGQNAGTSKSAKDCNPGVLDRIDSVHIKVLTLCVDQVLLQWKRVIHCRSIYDSIYLTQQTPINWAIALAIQDDPFQRSIGCGGCV